MFTRFLAGFLLPIDTTLKILFWIIFKNITFRVLH